MRITLYSQEEVQHYKLDQSDLEHTGDSGVCPSGGEIVENKTCREESMEMETGKPTRITHSSAT